MPPTTVHLNGSINLPDAETVFRQAVARIPSGLSRLPDGEPGERANWIGFQRPKLAAVDQLELEPLDPAETYVAGLRKLAVRDGADLTAIRWPDPGYGGPYLDSYATFLALQRDGAIPAGLRFQIQYPTPFAVIGNYVRAADVARLEPSYERALFADLDAFLAAVDHDHVAVQWDVAIEFAALEAPERLQMPELDVDGVVARLARCVGAVPADVPVGLHLCYGDYEHRHFADPTSLGLQVRVMNALADAAGRSVDWFSVTVPQTERAASFFAPLAELRLPAETELYLAVVPYHPEDQALDTIAAQVRLIDAALGSRVWGLCTECGMGRVAAEDVPAMLDRHSELLAR